MRPVIFLFLLSATHASAATAHDKPNVVVFFMDDMGYGDCRAYNPESKVALPNIESLAAQGMRFTDAIQPLCCLRAFSLQRHDRQLPMAWSAGKRHLDVSSAVSDSGPRPHLPTHAGCRVRDCISWEGTSWRDGLQCDNQETRHGNMITVTSTSAENGKMDHLIWVLISATVFPE